MRKLFMKMIRIMVSMVALITIVFSCKRNHKERNELVFQNKFEDVQDSLSKMEKLLSRLPKRTDNKNTNYYIKDEKLFISDSLISKNFITSILLSNVYTLEQKRDFLKLSYYLNENFLSSAYFDESDKLWRFIYKDFPESTFNDCRDVCLLDFSKTLTLSNDSVLDHKDKIYLLAPKDAEIR